MGLTNRQKAKVFDEFAPMIQQLLKINIDQVAELPLMDDKSNIVGTRQFQRIK